MDRLTEVSLLLLLFAMTPALAQQGEEEVMGGPVAPKAYVGNEASHSEPDTGPLAAALQERFRGRIAGIYVKREPDFHVVVRLTGDEGAGTLQYQLGEDRVRVDVQTGATHTANQLRSALSKHETIERLLPCGYGGYVDEQAGRLVLTIDIGSKIPANTEATLSEALGVPVHVVEQRPAVVAPAPEKDQ